MRWDHSLGLWGGADCWVGNGAGSISTWGLWGGSPSLGGAPSLPVPVGADFSQGWGSLVCVDGYGCLYTCM